MSQRGRLRNVAAALGSLAYLMLTPGLANAQEIGGAVSDATGGILPGVTVEARSPALIEQVRTTVTDGNGQYLIVALEPATYTVTYILPGFNTLVREDIELSTGFTASIDVQLTVGDVEETVTVSGASPVVDIQNVEQRQVMDRDIIDSIPTGRGLSSYGLLIPGMVSFGSYGTSLTQDAGGLTVVNRARMAIHGGATTDQAVSVNGMEVGDTFNQGALRAYLPDTNFEELSFSYSGNSAEVETGGLSINMIPRDGSNSFSGSGFTTFSFPGWMADNLDQDLRDRGLETGTALVENWTIAPSFGGPIVRDRVWFFLSHTSTQADLQAPGVFFAVDPAAFVFKPDLTRPSIDIKTAREQSLNLTFQVTSKDKVKAYWSNSMYNEPYTLQGRAIPIFLTPDAALSSRSRTNVYQLAWTRPHTNRLLFEAAVSHHPMRSWLLSTDVAVPTLPGILEVSPLRGHRNPSSFLGATRRITPKRVDFWRGSMSYVTGSHHLKIGSTYERQSTWVQTEHAGGWQRFQTFRGAPYRATFYGAVAQADRSNTLGIYAQEQWTLDRLTVNAGVRWDYIDTFYPDQERPTNIWIPSPFSVPGQTVATWNDFQPRLGAAYDLRGDGRTALKFSANRYGKRGGTGWSRAVNPAASNLRMNRSWFDGATSHPFGRNLSSCIGTTVVCIPGDGVVQGDPRNPLPNGEIVSPNVTPAFGLAKITTFLDPDWAFGRGNREANWELSGSIQQELLPGVSLDVGYFRRTWINRSVVDDRALGTANFELATVSIPTDPRLPGGGGGTLSFYDLRPGSVPVPDELTTSANNFGGESETWNGFDFTLDARVEGVLLQGGVSTGRVSHDYCDLVSQVPESAPSRPTQADTDALEHCNRSGNWLTQVKFLGSYTLPYDIQIAATLQNQPGHERQALQRFTAADADLGRPLVLYPSAVELNLVEPGTFYGERFNQVDFRVTKIFNFGTQRFRTMLDLFNVFNANAVTIEEPSFGPEWLAPTTIMPGRLVKVAFQFDF